MYRKVATKSPTSTNGRGDADSLLSCKEPSKLLRARNGGPVAVFAVRSDPARCAPCCGCVPPRRNEPRLIVACGAARVHSSFRPPAATRQPPMLVGDGA